MIAICQLFFLVAFYTVMVAGSHSIRNANRSLRKLANEQLERLNEIVGLDNQQYIVMKSLTKIKQGVRGVPLPDFDFQSCYQVSYISPEFRRFMVALGETFIEELLFREVKLVTKDMRKSESATNKNSSSHAHQNEVDEEWDISKANIQNLKQIVDEYAGTTTQSLIFEVKTLRRLQQE